MKLVIAALCTLQMASIPAIRIPLEINGTGDTYKPLMNPVKKDIIKPSFRFDKNIKLRPLFKDNFKAQLV